MRSPRFTLSAAAFALITAGMASAALGHRLGLDLTDEQRTCLETCRQADRDCGFDAREAMTACLEAAGCDALRTAYREACHVEERDETGCSAARDALKACVEPCRTAERAERDECRAAHATCASETCGITLPVRPTPSSTPGSGGPGRPGGHRAGHGHGPRGGF